MSLECDCLSPALVLGQQDARGAGTIGTRFGDWLKADKGIIFAFWRETIKSPKKGQNIQHPIFNFLRFGPLGRC